jgi:hypothetical protein
VVRSSVVESEDSSGAGFDVVCFGKGDEVLLEVLVRASPVSRPCVHGSTNTIFRGTSCLGRGPTCYRIRGLVYGQCDTHVFIADAGVGRPWTYVRGVAIEEFRDTASIANGALSALET